MKSRGIFAITAAFIAGIAARMGRALASSPSPSCSGRMSNGRDGFFGVSVPRTRQMRRRHPL